MHAQTTFSRTHTMPYSGAAVSAPRRQAEQRFWLFVYALLVFLITVALGAATLLFWWSGYLSVSVAPAVQVPESGNPSGALPPTGPLPTQPVQVIVQDSGPDAAPTSNDLGEAAPAQPTQVVPTPLEPTPVSDDGQPGSGQPEAPLPNTVDPEISKPPAQPEPVVEPNPTAEPIEEPERLQVHLPLEDDYHWQLSVPNGSSACGPTALLIALDYYNLQSSLPDLIAQASFSPAEGGYDPTCTQNAVCTSPQALARLASEEYGLDVQSGEGWTFDQVYAALEAGSPVIADIAWDASTTSLGHFVVIYGIDLESQVVYYHDPYYGAALSASWEDFHYRWSHTVDVGDPLQVGGYNRWGMAIYYVR